jgi:hypothetical protein
MTLEPTAVRLWKHLSRADRLAAATCFWREPPQEMLGAALAAIVKARRMRPQAARALSDEVRSQALAGILDPGEALAAALLVALHLGERRPLLKAFLDALGLPHEDGILKEEADALPPPTPEAVTRALAALGTFGRPEVEAYMNTLWLQDPTRWASLERVAVS